MFPSKTRAFTAFAVVCTLFGSACHDSDDDCSNQQVIVSGVDPFGPLQIVETFDGPLLITIIDPFGVEVFTGEIDGSLDFEVSASKLFYQCPWTVEYNHAATATSSSVRRVSSGFDLGMVAVDKFSGEFGHGLELSRNEDGDEDPENDTFRARFDVRVAAVVPGDELPNPFSPEFPEEQAVPNAPLQLFFMGDLVEFVPHSGFSGITNHLGWIPFDFNLPIEAVKDLLPGGYDPFQMEIPPEAFSIRAFRSFEALARNFSQGVSLSLTAETSLLGESHWLPTHSVAAAALFNEQGMVFSPTEFVDFWAKISTTYLSPSHVNLSGFNSKACLRRINSGAEGRPLILPDGTIDFDLSSVLFEVPVLWDNVDLFFRTGVFVGVPEGVYALWIFMEDKVTMQPVGGNSLVVIVHKPDCP